MNNNQVQLLKFLSASVNRTTAMAVNISKRNLRKLFKEADTHDITSLVYCGIKNIETLRKIDPELIDYCEKAPLLTRIFEIQNIDQIKNVFIEFNKQALPVMALKGLILRDLYLLPEQRTMYDADILVHESDLEDVTKLLTAMGYYASKTSEKSHITFKHTKYQSIEVHWTLGDHRYTGDISVFEKNLWANAIKTELDNIDVLTLCPEDFLVHLCINMAVQMRSTGFGIRDIYDLTLFTKEHNSDIDWSLFSIKIRAAGIETFVVSVFCACEFLLGLAIPKELTKEKLPDKKDIDMLISQIFSNRAYENRYNAQAFATNPLCSSTESEAANTSLVNSLVKFLSSGDLFKRKTKLLRALEL